MKTFIKRIKSYDGFNYLLIIAKNEKTAKDKIKISGIKTIGKMIEMEKGIYDEFSFRYILKR